MIAVTSDRLVAQGANKNTIIRCPGRRNGSPLDPVPSNELADHEDQQEQSPVNPAGVQFEHACGEKTSR